MNENRARLTLVPGRKRISLDRDAFRPVEPGPQATLFPEVRPGVVIFVCFPNVEEREFVSLLENARPSFVIDIRIVPRFDVGRLNRERAFGLFEMTEAEIRHWNEWLLAEGINPKPIRQDRPPGSSSYGWDPVLPATLEYAGGVRYFVGIADRKIARLAPVGAVPEIPVPFQAASRRSARLSAC